MKTEQAPQPALGMLTLAALGVVYGDIGTSPLYTLKECFAAEKLDVTPQNIYGFLSLIFWAIVLVVTLKYVVFVLRADNKGEGGVVVLMQEAKRHLQGRTAREVMLLGLLGAALFYGDVIITPAVSILSATEGMEILNSALKPYSMPLAMLIIVVLFLVQKYGSQRIGSLFGPAMFIWFLCLGALGLWHILDAPQVLRATHPRYAWSFVSAHGWDTFLGLGAVVLAITGAEALYADMGHFGRKPIRLAWFSLVLPGLCLNYFGQGALLINNPQAIQNPFYLLVPASATLPLIVIATLATIIASQAVISGAYSITRQAILLGFCPRMKVVHTSADEIGQIYVPAVNWLLFFAVLVVIGIFKSSANLAAAYGISVTATMAITSLLFFIVMVKNWRWPIWAAAGLTLVFLSFDIVLLVGNLVKLFHGGWLPIFIAMGSMLIFVTWMQGSRYVSNLIDSRSMLLTEFVHGITQHPPRRVEGAAIFFSGDPEATPAALLHNLEHNKVLHKQVGFLTVHTLDEAFADSSRRVNVETIGKNMYVINAYYGYQEIPNIRALLKLIEKHDGPVFEMASTTFFASRESIVIGKKKAMGPFRSALFAWLNRNSASRHSLFRVPPNRVVELGIQVEI